MLDLFHRRRDGSPQQDAEPDLGFTESPPAPRRPPLPKPERINRNALTIAAVVMGTLVIAAVVFMQPNRSTRTDERMVPATPPPLPQGTFLDQPMRVDSSQFVQPASPSALDPQSVPSQDVGPAMNPYAEAYAVPPPADPRVESYRAALEASVFASPARSPEMLSAWNGDTSAAPTEAPRPARPIGSNRDSESTLPRPTSIHTSVDPAPGPYAVQAGTLIPAVLLTGIDSDLPGEVLAQVSRDVYDSRTMRTLLLPKGSKLLGKYEDRVAVGQNRLLVAWSRVIFPDGRSVTLPGLETKDATGAGGLHDQVDRHARQVFGTATLLSLISAGVQLSQPRGSVGPYGLYPSAEQVAAGAVGRELADVATQMLRRDIDIRPTIRIRQGMPFNVYLNADLAFSGPYLAQR